MTIHMAWGWAVPGIASTDVETVEDAITVLVASIRKEISRHGAQEQADIMLNLVAPIRTEMRMEGADAMREGRDWSATHGGFFVSLSPR